MDVYEAIRSRRSVRRFRPDPIGRAVIERLLEAGGLAPSDNNIQPWRVYLVAGAVKARLSEAIINTIKSAPPGALQSEFPNYPKEWFEPYQGRRRKLGYDLYATLGIAREDKAGRQRQTFENYHFFGAPLGLFVTFDRRLSIGMLVAVGMFLENISIAARAEGLDTCAQAAFLPVHDVIRRELVIPESEMLACGMTIGYADATAPENSFAVDKLPVSGFTTFLGFDDQD